MRRIGFVLSIAPLALLAQTGQEGPRAEWPCVPGRAVDPAYVETSESTGGQLFLFQKNDFAKAGPFLTASYTHPQTVLRGVGTLSGSRDFEFAVDSTVKSVILMASLQCNAGIALFRPSGSEIAPGGSAQDADLKTGRLLQIDDPEPGQWKVRLAGTGLYVLSVQVNSSIGIHNVRFLDRSTAEQPESPASRQQPLLQLPDLAEIRVSGEVSNVSFQLIGPSGDPLARPESAELQDSGAYRLSFTALAERFRIVVTGLDASARPFQRTYPVLFRARPPQ